METISSLKQEQSIFELSLASFCQYFLSCRLLLLNMFRNLFIFYTSGTDAIKKLTPSLRIPYLGVQTPR